MPSLDVPARDEDDDACVPIGEIAVGERAAADVRVVDRVPHPLEDRRDEDAGILGAEVPLFGAVLVEEEDATRHDLGASDAHAVEGGGRRDVQVEPLVRKSRARRGAGAGRGRRRGRSR